MQIPCKYSLSTPSIAPRVLLGSSNLYVFYHPKELQAFQKAGKKHSPITYDLAQEEVAASSGFDMTMEGKTTDDILLREDLITLMPMLHEANAMSEELNKKVKDTPKEDKLDRLLVFCCACRVSWCFAVHVGVLPCMQSFLSVCR